MQDIRVDLRSLARALGGIPSGRRVLAPGPNHGRDDRSLSVWIDDAAPDGFSVHSFCGDDPLVCKDHVRARLGLAPWRPERRNRAEPIARQRPAPTPEAPPPRDDPPDRAPFAETDAGKLWAAAVPPGGTPVEAYLVVERGLSNIAEYLDGEVIRWLAHDWITRQPCMISLLRNVFTGEPQSVLRTYVLDGQAKHGRLFKGSNKQAAVMLDAFEHVTHGLMLGEGVETCATARQFGFRPTWAACTTATIQTFPLLSTIESLTLLRENDAGASDAACGKCAATWLAAGREVRSHRPPPAAKDLNDLTRPRRAAP